MHKVNIASLRIVNGAKSMSLVFLLCRFAVDNLYCLHFGVTVFDSASYCLQSFYIYFVYYALGVVLYTQKVGTKFKKHSYFRYRPIRSRLFKNRKKKTFFSVGSL